MTQTHASALWLNLFLSRSLLQNRCQSCWHLARPDVCKCVSGWHGTLNYRGRPLQSLCGEQRDGVMSRCVCVCVWAPSAGVCLSLISLLREYWGRVVPLPVNSVLMLSALHRDDGCADFRGLAEARLACRSVFLVHSRILWKRGGWRFCV